MPENTLATDWVSEVSGKERRLFSELNMLLRALDRAFNPENLPLSERLYTAKNFYSELSAVRDVIQRVLSILERVIPESRKNAFWFQKFAEIKFLSDRRRDLLKEGLYQQDRPEKSLFFLYDSFINLKVILNDLLRSNHVSYIGYRNFGDMLGREIRENRVFNPFRREIAPEFDTIDNRHISNIVKAIDDRGLRRKISCVFVYLFRFLRYLGHVEMPPSGPSSVSCAFLVFVLLRSEIRAFVGYLDGLSGQVDREDLKALLQSISFQFYMESKRVYTQELKDLLEKRSASQVRGRLENSSGILQNLTEQSIVQLACHFSPGDDPEVLFPSFITRIEQSVKLRDDVSVLHRFIEIFEEVFEDVGKRKRVFEALRDYMSYFESFTFKLLRYDDYEEFTRVFNEFMEISPEVLETAGAFKVLERARRFRIYLDTTLRLVSQRSELKDRPIREERVTTVIQQYLPSL